MGMFDFVKGIGKKLGFGDDEPEPTADTLKKELDSHTLGTDNVEVVVKGDTAVLKGMGQGSIDLRKSGHRRWQHARRVQGAGG